MELSREEKETLLQLLAQVTLPVAQTENILLPIMNKIRKDIMTMPVDKQG